MCPECEDELDLQPMTEEDEEETLPAKEVPGRTLKVTPDVQAQINTIRGGGQPLPESVRAFFEPRFGYDFSRVHIHTDAQAMESARAVNARAYTLGRDVVFGTGQFAPQTHAWKKLLAHELAHVVQQGRVVGGIQRPGFLDSTGVDGRGRKTEMQAAGSVRQRLGFAKLQRQADIAQAPPGLPCDALVTGPGQLPGTDVLFSISASTLSATQKADIAVFVSSWVADDFKDDVQVDGFASMDGLEDLNWRLSCEHAESVKAELIVQGLPAAKITSVAHGESNEFSNTALEPNRRAVITRQPSPVPPTPTPTPATPAPAPPVSPRVPPPSTFSSCVRDVEIDFISKPTDTRKVPAPPNFILTVNNELFVLGKATVLANQNCTGLEAGFFQICRPFAMLRFLYRPFDGGDDFDVDVSNLMRVHMPELDVEAEGDVFTRKGSKFAVPGSPNKDVIARLKDEPNVEIPTRIFPDKFLAGVTWQNFFFTTFSATLPGQNPLHLKSFFWEMQHCETFGPPPRDLSRSLGDSLKKTSVAKVNDLIDGAPGDEPGMEKMGKPASKTCNEMAKAAIKSEGPGGFFSPHRGKFDMEC